jgi:hypothetical protein
VAFQERRGPQTIKDSHMTDQYSGVTFSYVTEKIFTSVIKPGDQTSYGRTADIVPRKCTRFEDRRVTRDRGPGQMQNHNLEGQAQKQNRQDHQLAKGGAEQYWELSTQASMTRAKIQTNSCDTIAPGLHYRPTNMEMNMRIMPLHSAACRFSQHQRQYRSEPRPFGRG